MNGSARSRRPRLADAVVSIGLGLWGVIHVLGGVSLLLTDTVSGLETLGPDRQAPTDPGAAAEGLLRFHALNVALGGLAVLVLVAYARGRRCSWTTTALAIAAALDVGLVLFLVVPHVLPASQGLIGPVLVAVAAAAAIGGHRLDTAG
jgi:hypothetical protein